MFDDLVNSLLQESFRPVKAKERLDQLRKTPGGAFKAALITKKRDPNVEKALLDREKSYQSNYLDSSLLTADLVNYAQNVIQGRWPEAEPYILRSPYSTTWYAINVIKGAWPEAENIIKQYARLSNQYARHAKKGRFKEGEPIILGNTDEAVDYAIHVLHKRWPEAETILKAENEAPWLEYKDYFGIEEED